MDLDDVLTRCRNARFTGVLLVRSREAGGEIWLLSGIVDAARFGTDTGDAAMQRMASATNVEFEVVARLPGLTGGFKTRLEVDGPLGEATPVALMRHCELHAITCELDLAFGHATVHASYADGELRSIESNSPSESVATLLESREGRYRFVLPPPPQGVPVRDPGTSMRPQPPMEQAPGRAPEQARDSLGMRALTESRRATQIEASAGPGDDAEIKRKAVEQAAAVAKRKADAEAEAKRRAAAEAEAKRKADAEAEAKRKADAEAEAKRKADEQAAAEAKRKADEDAAEAEAKREADEQAAAEAKRKADEDAEEKRKAAAEAEAKREADEQAAAEVKRKADKEGAAKREPRAEAKPKSASAPEPTSALRPARSSKWTLWIIVAIVVAAGIAASVYARRRRGWPSRSSTSSPASRLARAVGTHRVQTSSIGNTADQEHG